MKKTDFRLRFVANWVVLLSIFVGAGGVQSNCARSNVSFTFLFVFFLISLLGPFRLSGLVSSNTHNLYAAIL